MIPPLDHRGLLPAGIYPATLAEIIAFADGETRQRLADGLGRFIARELLPWASGLTLDVGGSYFSDKSQPEDIEATLRVGLDLAAKRIGQLTAVGSASNKDRLMREYRLDFYITLEGLGNDFSAFFQYVGPKTAALKHIDPRGKRGIVRLTL